MQSKQTTLSFLLASAECYKKEDYWEQSCGLFLFYSCFATTNPSGGNCFLFVFIG